MVYWKIVTYIIILIVLFRIWIIYGYQSIIDGSGEKLQGGTPLALVFEISVHYTELSLTHCVGTETAIAYL